MGRGSGATPTLRLAALLALLSLLATWVGLAAGGPAASRVLMSSAPHPPLPEVSPLPAPKPPPLHAAAPRPAQRPPGPDRSAAPGPLLRGPQTTPATDLLSWSRLLLEGG